MRWLMLNFLKYVLNIYDTVKTQLIFFWDIYKFLHQIILHTVKNIVWNYILCIFNNDWEYWLKS